MSNYLLFAFVALVVVLFLAYGQAVRRGQLDGRNILLAGLGIGIVAVGGTVALLYPAVSRGAPPVVLIVNGGAMALSTLYCIVFAYRQARVEEIAAVQIEQTRVIVRTSSAWRLGEADALLLPTTTTIRSIGGPTGPVLLAAGRETERGAAQSAPVATDKVFTLPAGRLSVGQIVGVAVAEPLGNVDAGRLKRGMAGAAQIARKLGAHRIIVPFAPLRGLSAEACADAMVSGTLRHRRNFSEIVFVALDGRGAAELSRTLARRGEE